MRCFWGKNPVGYHLTSNLLHALNAALVFLLLRRLTAGTPNGHLAAAAGALIFAVHPLLVEPVAEVSSREDPLAVFYPVSAWVRPESGRGPSPGSGRPPVCLLAVLLACGAKELGVVAPVLILLCGLMFRGEESLRRWLGLSAGAFVVAAGFLVARFPCNAAGRKFFSTSRIIWGGLSGHDGGDSAAHLGVLFSAARFFWPTALSAEAMWRKTSRPFPRSGDMARWAWVFC